MNPILIIIPTYNERENLPKLIPEILNLGLGTDILVIDDASPDGTGEVAETLARDYRQVHVLHRPGKLGLGSAYREGFRYALARQYEYIFEMDADFSHDPRHLPEFLEAMAGTDLVVGSRYLNGVTVVNWPMKRLLLSYCANLYARVVTGLPVKDCTAGFKCFRRRVLEAIPLEEVHSNGYAFQIEMNFRAWKQSFRLREIPILFVDRNVGTSKMSHRIIWEAVWMVWRLRLLGWRMRG